LAGHQLLLRLSSEYTVVCQAAARPMEQPVCLSKCWEIGLSRRIFNSAIHNLPGIF